MGNWNREEIKTEHDSLQLFWTHNKDRAVYTNHETLHISDECWYRYPIGKYFCSFNAIINHRINEELTIYIGPLLLDNQPYKSLLNFASTWSTDIVRLYFHDIKTAFAFIRDFDFIRIGCLIINVNVNPLSEISEQDK